MGRKNVKKEEYRLPDGKVKYFIFFSLVRRSIILKMNSRRAKRRLVHEIDEDSDLSCRASKILRIETGTLLPTVAQCDSVSYTPMLPPQKMHLMNHSPVAHENTDNFKKQYCRGHVDHQQAMYLERLAREEIEQQSAPVRSQSLEEVACGNLKNGWQLDQRRAPLGNSSLQHCSSFSVQIDGTQQGPPSWSSHPSSSTCSSPMHVGFSSSYHDRLQNSGYCSVMNQFLGSLNEERRQRMGQTANQNLMESSEMVVDQSGSSMN